MANNSYDFNNTIRNVNTAFDLMMSNTTSLLSMMPLAGSQEITNTKHEWVNDKLSPVSSTIGSFDSNGDGTGINLVSTTGIIVGSILRFTSVLDVTRTELVVVSVVDVNGTDLTVVRDYAGSTGVTLVVGDKCFLVSSPKGEGSAAGTGLIHQGSMIYNYTEIFDQIAEVSKTSNAVSAYDGYTKMSNQEMIAMKKIAYKLENALIWGNRLIGSSGVPATMNGLKAYIGATGGNIDTTGGAISQTVLNNMLENIFAKGGDNQNLALICNVNQARRISALGTGTSNPVINKADTVDQRLGNYVSEFVSDIPLPGGLNARIFTNYNMPKDQVMLLDMSKIALKVLRPMQIEDASTAGTDSLKSRILTELTLEVKNPLEAHAIATGLTV